MISAITVTDLDRYAGYRQLSTEAIKALGGTVLVRGGKSEVLEGTFAKRIVVVEFADFDTARDFAELVVPELRKRGRLPEEGSNPGTLRERLFGAGNSRLPDRHIAARYRGGANLDVPVKRLDLAGGIVEA